MSGDGVESGEPDAPDAAERSTDPAVATQRTTETRPPRAASLRDVRTALAIGGAALFTPPILFLADRDITILGVPFLVVYVFGAWLAGIVITFVAARRDGGGVP